VKDVRLITKEENETHVQRPSCENLEISDRLKRREVVVISRRR
jgi:hypothetical protein